ncbi:MAG: hypothetical protein Q8K79_03605 [Solirubrobacteraceae bacterium]|nr:hypothetical protein [Solirubrobacteraceae bacterium]
MRGRRAVVIAAVAFAGAVAGCGGDGELPAKRGLAASIALVSPADIVREKPHSPERAFLAWWRTLQYTDLRGYLSLLSQPLRDARRADGMARVQLPIISQQVNKTYPHVKRVELAGNRATLYVNVEHRTLVGADRYSSTQIPQAFAMVREDGRWRIADDIYVEAAARPQLREEAAADARAGVRTTPRPTTTTAAPDQPAAGLPATGAGR